MWWLTKEIWALSLTPPLIFPLPLNKLTSASCDNPTPYTQHLCWESGKRTEAEIEPAWSWRLGVVLDKASQVNRDRDN